jgi:hypothetical protein
MALLFLCGRTWTRHASKLTKALSFVAASKPGFRDPRRQGIIPRRLLVLAELLCIFPEANNTDLLMRRTARYHQQCPPSPPSPNTCRTKKKSCWISKFRQQYHVSSLDQHNVTTFLPVLSGCPDRLVTSKQHYHEQANAGMPTHISICAHVVCFLLH